MSSGNSRKSLVMISLESSKYTKTSFFRHQNYSCTTKKKIALHRDDADRYISFNTDQTAPAGAI